MTTIFVGLVVFSLSLVYSNGQRRPSDWGSPRFGQGNFGDERGIGRGTFGGFRPNQMGPDFGQSGRGGIDRDLFGSRDPNEMGQGGGVGRGQPMDPQQGVIPTPVQPSVGQIPEIGQREVPGQPQLPESPDQIAQEQEMGQPQIPATPDPGQFLGRGQGEIPVPTQPSMTQAPGENGQGLPPPSQPPIPTQGQPPMRQTPDLRGMEQNGGIGRGGLSPGRREIPVPQQPPMGIDPNQVGPGEQATLGGPVQNELPSVGPPTVNANPGQVGRPQTRSLIPGQTQPSQRRSEFGDRDIDELTERMSRPPRGK